MQWIWRCDMKNCNKMINLIVGCLFLAGTSGISLADENPSISDNQNTSPGCIPTVALPIYPESQSCAAYYPVNTSSEYPTTNTNPQTQENSVPQSPQTHTTTNYYYNNYNSYPQYPYYPPYYSNYPYYSPYSTLFLGFATGLLIGSFYNNYYYPHYYYYPRYWNNNWNNNWHGNTGNWNAHGYSGSGYSYHNNVQNNINASNRTNAVSTQSHNTNHSNNLTSHSTTTHTTPHNRNFNRSSFHGHGRGGGHRR